MAPVVTVAIPTLDAGPAFAQTLRAIADQRVAAEIELLVCDSQSRDGTAALARRHGAKLLTIERSRFSHGGTRNRLMAAASGERVAFLTQDAVPADSGWLAALLSGFALAPRVGLVFGPYRPVPTASVSVVRELTEWFGSLSDDGQPRVDSLPPGGRNLAPHEFLGRLGYFTDANGCVDRAAWEHTPFREADYAEDHLLAQDMLRAGYAKAYVPAAAVVHSHDYRPSEWLRRSFDEARALQAIYGVVPGSHPPAAVRAVRAAVARDLAWSRAHPGPGPAAGGSGAAVLARSLAHHLARAAGTVIGARHARVPPRLRAQLSLERRR